VSYITNTDIEKRLGSAAYVQLTDDDGDGVADAGVVEEARLGAEGEVDSYLAVRYAVPVDVFAHAELAGLLAATALDLVEYRLRCRRPPAPADIIRKRCEAIDWLERVAAGRIDLPAVSPIDVNVTRGPVASTTGAQRVLSRDELSDY